jgi:hypothetical protein
MKKILPISLLTIAALFSSSPAQELFTEIQAKVTPDEPLYTFRILGDRENAAFAAYGIHVITPTGTEQMIDEFDSLLPEGSEADSLYVEDVNFDGFADLRIMEYLPGGANVPYLFWLYNPETQNFEKAPAFQVVVSPQVDRAREELISRQRVSAAEYVTEYYKPVDDIPVLLRREERKYNPDGSSVLKLYEVKDDSGLQLVESKELGPEE